MFFIVQSRYYHILLVTVLSNKAAGLLKLCESFFRRFYDVLEIIYLPLITEILPIAILPSLSE